MQNKFVRPPRGIRKIITEINKFQEGRKTDLESYPYTRLVSMLLRAPADKRHPSRKY